MLLPDYPIEKKENDQLGRSRLATKVAEMVSKFNGKESFVIGIEGPWGAGKTSFVNLVLSELKPEETIIIHFNPWNFAGQNELIADFFSTFLEGIASKVGKDEVKIVKSYASKLQISFSPSIPIPFVGTVTLGELWKKTGPSLQTQRKQIDDTLSKINKKIVVVVDDIDRLDRTETRLIMKLVKMTANFPNTIFLLAYDRVHVASRLKDDGWPGDEFLKKIVQVSFTLPKPDDEGMRKLLFKDLDATIEMFYGKFELEGENEKRWGQLLIAGFPNLFKTIRDIKRYASSLRLNWSTINIADINMIDFMTIEAIRVFFPRFYSIIAENKSVFLGAHNLYASMSQRNDPPTRAQQLRELLDEAEITIEKERDIVTKICTELFPQLKDQNYGGDWEIAWRNDQRICADNRFDLYFQLAVPLGGVSEVEVNRVLNLLENKVNFSDEIVRLSSEKRIRPILSRITDRLETLSKNQLETLLLTLWDLESKVKDEKTAVFDFDDFDSISFRIGHHTLKGLGTKKERKEFLDKTVKATDSIYNPVRLIRTMEEEIAKNNPEEMLLLTAPELEDSKKILTERIAKWAAENNLHKVPHLPFVLYTWKIWAGDDPVKRYVSELVKIEDGAAFLIEGFVGMTYTSNGNYKDINKKTIDDLYPIQDLEKIVSAITDTDLEKMTQDQREAIAVFRNPPKNWFS